jgi:hypothetical protein
MLIIDEEVVVPKSILFIIIPVYHVVRLVFQVLYYFLLYSLIIKTVVVATKIINVYYSNKTDRTLEMVKKQM